MTTAQWGVTAAAMFAPTPHRWATPGMLARSIDPRLRQTPALDLIDEALVELADTPDGRLIITMSPQEGKSDRVAKWFPLWLLLQDPDRRVVTASYGQGLANRNGRAIRNTITASPQLGLRIAPDNGSVSDWTIAGRKGGVLSVGIGAGVTGRPADLMIIDDPVKDRKEADSPTYRDSVWDWWTDSASTRLAPGAPVVVILTRWHEKDLAGRLLAAEDGHLWRVINIPAQADHDPEQGETDPLGREVGEFVESARGRTPEQWAAIKVRVGSRTWNALYQGRPAPPEGSMFHRDWWQRYETPQYVERDDGSRWLPGTDPADLLMSWDMTFKDTEGTDYVCGGVWLRRGAQMWLLDLVHGRMDIIETIRQFRMLTARWPQCVLKLVEDKANGPAVIALLKRTVPGIVPVEPEGSKAARAAAATPLVEAKQVFLPSSDLLPKADDLIEEAASFPSGAHDDYVDMFSQAANRMIIQPLGASMPQTQYDPIYDEPYLAAWPGA